MLALRRFRIPQIASFSLLRTMAHVAADIKIPALNKTISVPTGLFINNEFVPSVDSKETIQSVQ